MFEKKLGWRAQYVDGKTIEQYPKGQPETLISVMGIWTDFKLSENLPKLFMVGRSGVDLIHGGLLLEGRWYPPPPGSSPVKLIYYRTNRASLNSGKPIQCWHYIGYEDVSGAVIKICVPDDGTKPTVALG